MENTLNTTVIGHVLIQDRNPNDPADVVTKLDQKNAIHPQNMARVIAKALANEQGGNIYTLALGNGGTYIDSSQQIVYLPPQTTLTTANLYNETYSEVIDDANTAVGLGNSVTSMPSAPPAVTSVVTVTIILTADEPAGQQATDNVTTNPEAPFVFDELGLKNHDGLLMTHIVFSPIEKTASREIIVTYTLTISVS